jgi:hypothetical protein
VWKQLFHALRKSFNTEFSATLRNMREYQKLIESQANIAQLEELVRIRETTSTFVEQTKVEEAQSPQGDLSVVFGCGKRG